jgi:hypothetical protein
MKKIILATLASLSMTSMSFAYYATPGTIVSEPKIINNGFKDVGFNDVTSSSVKKNYALNVMTTTRDVQGRMNSKIRVRAWHNIAIYNSSRSIENYAYTVQIRCANAFFSRTQNVTLQPQGKFSTNLESLGDVVQEEEGSWGIIANTYAVGNGEGLRHQAHAKLYVTQ